MFKNVATTIALFAFDTTTGVPKSGDAANLTAYVSKDYGAVTVLADTSATEMDATNAKGWYLFAVAQAESNADALLFTGKSATANVTVVGQYIHTTPNRFTTLVIDAAGLADANAVKVGPTGAGTAQTARDVGASVLLSTGTGTGQLDFTSGVVKANLAQILGTALTETAGQIAAAFRQFFNIASPTSTMNVITTVTTATTATNLTNAATAGDFTATMKTSIGTAVAASAVASVTGNVGGSVASIAAGGITEASFATTAGSFHPLGVVDQGTAQAATGTTLQLRAAAAFADDEIIGSVIEITGGTTGVGQSRAITDYVSATDTATVDAWTTTPTGTITYKIWASPPLPVALPAVNVTQISGDSTAADNAEAFFDGTGYAGTNNVIPTVTNLTNAPTAGDLTATMKASVNAEVVDALNVDTYAEPGQGTPPATATLVQKIGYLAKAWRNRHTQSTTEYKLYNDDATTVDHKAAASDDTTTFERGEVATGP